VEANDLFFLGCCSLNTRICTEYLCILEAFLTRPFASRALVIGDNHGKEPLDIGAFLSSWYLTKSRTGFRSVIRRIRRIGKGEDKVANVLFDLIRRVWGEMKKRADLSCQQYSRLFHQPAVFFLVML